MFHNFTRMTQFIEHEKYTIPYIVIRNQLFQKSLEKYFHSNIIINREY